MLLMEIGAQVQFGILPICTAFATATATEYPAPASRTIPITPGKTLRRRFTGGVQTPAGDGTTSWVAAGDGMARGGPITEVTIPPVDSFS
jgi:hypothetical protein